MRRRVVYLGFGLAIGLAVGSVAGYGIAIAPWAVLFKHDSKITDGNTGGSPLNDVIVSAVPKDGEDQCTFTAPPYIHPRIIKDLMTWLSDLGDQVVAINLLEAQGSNRYAGDVSVRKVPGEQPFVSVKGEREEFGYRYVGQTASGVHVLYTSDWSGGSGAFNRLLLLKMEEDKGLTVNWKRHQVLPDRRRVLLRKLGEISLGDRWNGKLSVKGNDLLIGKNEGWFSKSGGTGGDPLSREDRVLKVKLGRTD